MCSTVRVSVSSSFLLIRKSHSLFPTNSFIHGNMCVYMCVFVEEHSFDFRSPHYTKDLLHHIDTVSIIVTLFWFPVSILFQWWLWSVTIHPTIFSSTLTSTYLLSDPLLSYPLLPCTYLQSSLFYSHHLFQIIWPTTSHINFNFYLMQRFLCNYLSTLPPFLPPSLPFFLPPFLLTFFPILPRLLSYLPQIIFMIFKNHYESCSSCTAHVIFSAIFICFK